MRQQIETYPALGWDLWRVLRASWCFLAGHTSQLDTEGLYLNLHCPVTCSRCRRRIVVR